MVFAVDEWYKSGKPTKAQNPHNYITPMQIAIKTGQHSLAEVLLRNGASPTDPMRTAIWHEKSDLVRLFLGYGADIREISFKTGTVPSFPMLEMLIGHGLDMETGYPIAAGIKTAIWPYLKLYQLHVKKHPKLRVQADIALRHFVRIGNLASVKTMLRVGANPRRKAPLKWGEPKGLWGTALDDAFHGGWMNILKTIGLDRRKDNLQLMLCVACRHKPSEIIEYIIDRGGDVNSGFEDISFLNDVISELDDARKREGVNTYGRWSWLYKNLEVLINRGAKWKPSSEKEFRKLRRVICAHGTYRGLEFIKYLKSKDFCTDQMLADLLNDAEVRALLHPRRHAIKRLVPSFKYDKPKRGQYPPGTVLCRIEASAYSGVPISTLRRLSLKGTFPLPDSHGHCSYPIERLEAYLGSKKPTRKRRPAGQK